MFNPIAPVVHRCHSARLSLRCETRILKMDYSGPITLGAFHKLDLASVAARRAAPVALERMDLALTLVREEDVWVDPLAWAPGIPPSVVLVREDQFAASMAFCRQLACMGVVRLTYLLTESQRAFSFADAVVQRSLRG